MNSGMQKSVSGTALAAGPTEKLAARAWPLLFALFIALSTSDALAESTYVPVINGVQPKIVKVYGAGGLHGLEHYQSGFLVSAEGHVLSAWSYVLDSDEVI